MLEPLYIAWSIFATSLASCCFSCFDPRPCGCSLVMFGISIHTTLHSYDTLTDASRYTMFAFTIWASIQFLWFVVDKMFPKIQTRLVAIPAKLVTV